MAEPTVVAFRTVRVSESQSQKLKASSIWAVCRWGEKVGEKVTSVTVAHCSTFRLFVVNIVLP